MMSNLEIDLYSYYGIAGDMESKFTVYVEGGQDNHNCYDKMFYSQFGVFDNTLMHSVGSCSNVKKHTQNHTKSVGVIDKDYNNESNNNVFTINYYSVENIFLVHHVDFEKLKKSISDTFNLRAFDVSRVSMLEFNLDPHSLGTCILREKYQVGCLTSLGYIVRNIHNDNDYLKYFKLKDLVNRWMKHHTNFSSYTKAEVYKNSLTKMNINSGDLFNFNDYNKLKKILVES